MAESRTTGEIFDSISASEFISTRIDTSSGTVNELLPASGDTGNVKLYIAIDVTTNVATLIVQSGETLNGVTDGTFLFSNYADGTQFRVDEVTGGWVVAVIGATSNVPFEIVPAAVTDIIGISGATFVTNDITPAAGALAVNDVYYYDNGPMRHVFVNVAWQEDSEVVMQLGPNVMPVGGQILSAHMTGNEDTNNGTTTMAGFVTTDADQFFVNRIDSIDNDSFGIVELTVHNPAGEGAAVLAGMVTPTSLKYLQVMPSVDQIGVVNNDVIVFDTEVYRNAANPAGAGESILLSGNQFTIPAGNTTYKLTGAGFPFFVGTTATSDFRVQWYDPATAQFIGTASRQGHTATGTAHPVGGSHEAIAYVDATSVARAYELRVLNISGVDSISATTGTYASVEELPTSTVVMPDALEVTDRRDLLGSGTLSDGQIIDIGQSWGGLSTTYEAVDFEMITPDFRFKASVPTNDWNDNAIVHFYNDGISQARFNNMDIAGTTATYFESATAFDTATIRIYGVRAQKTVINTVDTPTNDQTASGYMDIGDMRMQWGKIDPSAGSGNANTIVFPAAFANTNYAFTATALGGATDQSRNVTVRNSPSATSIDVEVYNPTNHGSTTSGFTWIAIGPKP